MKNFVAIIVLFSRFRKILIYIETWKHALLNCFFQNTQCLILFIIVIVLNRYYFKAKVIYHKKIGNFCISVCIDSFIVCLGGVCMCEGREGGQEKGIVVRNRQD